ncbi:hypothetical protein MG293_000919 [Ovis ammon polii]|uniref:Uncharacterized protein n=1 Tax=Ovis ammon polii TaxID=230172 RepID=A0AAD4YHK5_OVIAM|nr:hypothetical protein MG293_000919 [Ovis ammon polii]
MPLKKQNFHILNKDGDVRDAVLIPELKRYPGEGNGYPLQYSCLENPMDKEASLILIIGEGNGNPLQYSCLENTMDEEPDVNPERGGKEIPLVQGKEQRLCFAGAAMKRYPTWKGLNLGLLHCKHILNQLSYEKSPQFYMKSSKYFIDVSQKNGEGNGTPLQYSCLENPIDGGAWWAAVHGVVKSLT